MDIVNNINNLMEVAKALRKVHFRKQKQAQFKQLFDDEENSRSKVNLVVSLCKIPKIPVDGKVQPVTVKSTIPHSFVDDCTDVLLITKNLKGFKKEFQHTVQHYEDLLRDHGASSLITQVMSIGQIKYEHCEFESKRALSSRFDIVLCDAGIMKLLPRLLGKPFYSKKKRPIPINIKAKDLKNEIEKVLSMAYLHMNLEGSSAMTQVARLNQADEEIASNIGAVVKALKKKSNFPGGWKNVRSLHIKTEFSKAIPIYLNIDSPQKIKEVKHPNDKIIEFVDGEFDMLPDSIVHVTKGGDVTKIPKILEASNTSKYVKKIRRRMAKKYNIYDPKSDKIIKGRVGKSPLTWRCKKPSQVPKAAE